MRLFHFLCILFVTVSYFSSSIHANEIEVDHENVSVRSEAQSLLDELMGKHIEEKINIEHALDKTYNHQKHQSSALDILSHHVESLPVPTFRSSRVDIQSLLEQLTTSHSSSSSASTHHETKTPIVSSRRLKSRLSTPPPPPSSSSSSSDGVFSTQRGYGYLTPVAQHKPVPKVKHVDLLDHLAMIGTKSKANIMRRRREQQAQASSTSTSASASSSSTPATTVPFHTNSALQTGVEKTSKTGVWTGRQGRFDTPHVDLSFKASAPLPRTPPIQHQQQKQIIQSFIQQHEHEHEHYDDQHFIESSSSSSSSSSVDAERAVAEFDSESQNEAVARAIAEVEAENNRFKNEAIQSLHSLVNNQHDDQHQSENEHENEAIHHDDDHTSLAESSSTVEDSFTPLAAMDGINKAQKKNQRRKTKRKR